MTWANAVMVLCAAAAFSPAGRAELIAVDWEAAGDRLLVRDTATGLEWLRVSYTLGQSFDAVTARLHGGDLAGFTFATTAQVDTFFSNAKTDSPDGIQRLVDLWGPGRSWSWGLIGVSAITQTVTANWPDSLWLAEVAYQTDPVANPGSPSFANAMNGSIQHDFGYGSVGSALFRVSEVPEPAAWLGCLAGLAGTLTLGRRQTRPARDK